MFKTAVALLMITLGENIVAGPLKIASVEADSTLGWKKSAIGSATFTTVQFSEWKQGGTNSLAYTVALEGKVVYNAESYVVVNAYNFAYGQAKLQGQGVRKTDDKIDMESVYSYKLGTLVNPYAAISFKSQFDAGYTYDKQGIATAVSKFLDPGYLTESVGAGFRILPEVKTRLGVALKQTFTDRYRLYSDDPGTTQKTENFKLEGGVESVTEVEWKVVENVAYVGKLELFSPVKEPQRMVIRGDNTISAKVNSFIRVSLTVQFISDPQVTLRTQSKTVLGIGISYTFL